jgi:hypothetical protein
MIMRRIFLDFFSGLILSIIGFLMFAGLYSAFELLRININYGGDKGKVLFGLFFGLPLGSILGIVLTEKLVYKAQGWNILGIILAALLSVIGNYLGIIMLDRIGGWVFILIPLLVVSICVFGYNIVFLFK